MPETSRKAKARAARAERLAAALKANIARRKAQARERADDDATAGAEGDPSDSAGRD